MLHWVYSLDLKCICINPTSGLEATAKLMFVKDFNMLWGFAASVPSDGGVVWGKLCLWEVPKGLNVGEESRRVDLY